MLNSAEHEILNAHKYKNIEKFSFFSGSEKPRMLFLLLMNFEIYEQEKFCAPLRWAWKIFYILEATSQAAFVLI